MYALPSFFFFFLILVILRLSLKLITVLPSHVLCIMPSYIPFLPY